MKYLRTAFSTVGASNEFDMATTMLVTTSISTLECLKQAKLDLECEIENIRY